MFLWLVLKSPPVQIRYSSVSKQQRAVRAGGAGHEQGAVTVHTLTWSHLITAQVRAVAPHAGVGQHRVPVTVTLTAKESTESTEQQLPTARHPHCSSAFISTVSPKIKCENEMTLTNDMQNSH